MTRPLDPDIKAMRAITRALDALPDDKSAQRVIEWTVARAAHKPWITLPRLRWGSSVGACLEGEQDE